VAVYVTMNEESRKRRLLSEEEIEEEILDEIEKDLLEEPTVSDEIKALKAEVTGNLGLRHRMEELDAQLSDLTNDFVDLRAENFCLKNDLTLLKSILVKKDKEISALKDKVADITSRDMRSNILLHGYPEKRNENCEAVLRQVISTHTKLTEKQVARIGFDRVHRMGQPADGLCRVIVAKVTFYKDKEAILSAWRANSKSADGGDLKLKLTNHLPPEVLEKRAMSFKEVENMKAKCSDPSTLDVKVNVDKVYVNKQLVKPKVQKPTTEEILNVTTDEKHEVSHLKSGSSGLKMERGSCFKAVAYKVKSIGEVRMAYKLHCANPVFQAATHNILAYNTEGESGWCDDGEYGAGRILTSWMNRTKVKDTCFIITRNYGGTHLGTKRFELMRECAVGAQERLLDNLR